MFCNIHGLISIVSGDADYVIHACLKIEVKVCAYYDVTYNRQATEQVPTCNRFLIKTIFSLHLLF